MDDSISNKEIIPEPTPVTAEPVKEQPLPPEIKKKNYKKLMLLIGILIVAVTLILVLIGYVSGKKTANLPPKEPENVLLATVGDKKIYRNDIKQSALEQYQESAVNEEVIKLFLDINIEHTILDREAELLKLNMSDENINGKRQLATKVEKDLAKYSYIKQQIMKQQVKSIDAHKIGFWIASFDYPQKPEYEIQREDGVSALLEIESALLRGDKPTNIATYIMTKYKSLENIISINGYRFSKAVDKEVLNKTKVYTYNPADMGKASYDKEVGTVISTIKHGEVVRVNRTDGSGGDVIKAINVNSDGFNSFEEFMSQRKKELVKLEQS